ncbi:pilus assembly protein [Aliiroseovarius sp. KMU-50]|uniref:Pilus assembly protein n=1 Tax=Aliiroseovarius salicola TaxID=3009082 RepID=A0ABT4VZD8_9RHOB|nr:TadE family protein [Aliiroseovarius sp. KMU-50]MDA5093100.1 pilus assembly protein [Aliiroseovarius sp. KMU-50]
MMEGIIVLPVVILVFAVMIEFGFAVFQWNQTVKALQLGARVAVVSDPLVDTTSAQWTALTNPGTAVPGDPFPDSTVSASCGAGTGVACQSAELNRLIYGVAADGSIDTVCAPGLGLMPGMCDFNTKLRPEHVWVSYQRSGLGYVGRPLGPVLTVTVGTNGLGFELPFLGALGVFNFMSIPAHPVTVTSEDLSSTSL